MTYAEITDTYFILRGKLASKAIGKNEFIAEYKKLRTRDDTGTWWRPNRATGEWEFFNGETWEPGRPHGEAAVDPSAGSIDRSVLKDGAFEETYGPKDDESPLFAGIPQYLGALEFHEVLEQTPVVNASFDELEAGEEHVTPVDKPKAFALEPEVVGSTAKLAAASRISTTAPTGQAPAATHTAPPQAERRLEPDRAAEEPPTASEDGTALDAPFVELARSYIGKRAERFFSAWRNMEESGTTSVLNRAMFFFSVLYLAYRKMWMRLLLYVVLAAAAAVAGLFVAQYLGHDSVAAVLIPPAVVHLVFAYRVNFMYYKKTQKAIERQQKRSPDREELLRILASKGGTSVLAVLGLLVVMLLLLAVAVLGV